MPLYPRLLALSTGHVRTEDVLTEVVAHLFRLDLAERGPADAVVTSWLRLLKVIPESTSVMDVRIDTQRTYPPLRPDEASSRPDVVLEIDREGEAPLVVFVESKVGSVEGTNQLNRYARTLAAAHGGGALLYLTRDLDPKDATDVLRDVLENAVTFQQTRWHEVYRAVQGARTSAPAPLGAMYDDLLSFFRHLNMDHEPHFTRADAVALSRIPHTFRFLDATLRDTSARPADASQSNRLPNENVLSPSHRFTQILHGSKQKAVQVEDIFRHKRYTLKKKYGTSDARFEVLLGYSFEREGFPVVKLDLGALSRSKGSRRVADLIQTLVGKDVKGPGETTWRWESHGSREHNWEGALVQVPLETLLAKEDHAAEIREILHLLLNELERTTHAMPELPWDSPEDVGTASDE